jgi:thiamine transporter ThiT
LLVLTLHIQQAILIYILEFMVLPLTAYKQGKVEKKLTTTVVFKNLLDQQRLI